MASERYWVGFPTRLFISNGNADGRVQVLSTVDVKVKQKVLVTSNTQNSLSLEVKKVLNETDLILGPINKYMNGPESIQDLSLYLQADGSAVRADYQDRPAIYMNEWSRSVFEEEPTVAIRTFAVDHLGRRWSEDNPFPVQLSNGSIDIGTVNAQLEMFLTHKDNDPHVGDVHSSLRIGNGVYELQVNPDGSINVVSNSSNTQTPTIFNLDVVNANTEYEYEFPTATKQFTIKDRAGDAKTRVAYISGNTDTVYETIGMGVKHEVNNLSTLAGFKIYVQSNKSGRVLEIVSWA